MSTHNICFRGEIRKIFTGYPPLTRPMVIVVLDHQHACPSGPLFQDVPFDLLSSKFLCITENVHF